MRLLLERAVRALQSRLGNIPLPAALTARLPVLAACLRDTAAVAAAATIGVRTRAIAGVRRGAAATATKGVVPDGGIVYGNEGAARDRSGGNDSYPQGGGGAGGKGIDTAGGPGITRSITGTPVSYAAGGGGSINGEQGTGNGGKGGQGVGGYSYSGGSGVVIVRFRHPGNTNQ